MRLWFPLIVGVAHSERFTALPNSFPLGPLLRPSGLKPCGVGQSLATMPKSMFRPRASSFNAPASDLAPFEPSVARGVGSSFRKSLGDRPPERIAEAFVLLASGVGNNPEPVTAVRGANGTSGNAVPPSVVPERGQVTDDGSKSSNKER